MKQGCVDFFYWIMKYFNINLKKRIEAPTEVTVEANVEPAIPESSVDETKKEEVAPVDPGDYVVDEKENNLFHNIKHKEFSIRILKNHPNGKERDKDQLIFATSVPHKFNAFTLKALQTYAPQLTDFDFSKNHEILITKSAASNFEDLRNSILRFIFLRLNREYSWLYEEQTVLIESCPNSNVLTFNLRVQTCQHIELGKAMFEINGISAQLAGESFPLCMDHKNNYDFNLEKGAAFTWNELLPQIKEVFAKYFTGGVKFINKNNHNG